MNTTATHTPGPWHRNIRANGKYPVVFAGRNTHIAVVQQQRDNPNETEANIDLIASAPELLASLKELHVALAYMLRPDVHPDFSHQQVAKAWADSQKIITKAEGR